MAKNEPRTEPRYGNEPITAPDPLNPPAGDPNAPQATANLYPGKPVRNDWPAGLPRVWNRHTGEEVTDVQEAVKIFDQYRRTASLQDNVYADPATFDPVTKRDPSGRRLEEIHPPPPEHA